MSEPKQVWVVIMETGMGCCMEARAVRVFEEKRAACDDLLKTFDHWSTAEGYTVKKWLSDLLEGTYKPDTITVYYDGHGVQQRRTIQISKLPLPASLDHVKIGAQWQNAD